MNLPCFIIEEHTFACELSIFVEHTFINVIEIDFAPFHDTFLLLSIVVSSFEYINVIECLLCSLSVKLVVAKTANIFQVLC